ncbi:MAG: GIY-YIG nuclease family protein [Alphaproteobacteria bacterium]|jgi:putative endonuclease|nr:GIY-YIG nuclease family protein [Alphaproteobacteria bacterium]MDP6833205.1 GIY-YIG nuclease family protein [Alphaproteobacteria bacterium]
MPKPGYVYLLSSQRGGTLYIGVTSNLAQRIWQHREGLVDGFTGKHGVNRLVYIEAFDDIEAAIAREKAMKKWRRRWKIDAIEGQNPEWRDLYGDIQR